MAESIPISALQHFLYCPRQCALIHLEQSYSENVYTLRGNRVHEKVHESGSVTVAGIRVERALPLYSDALGLTGIADVVEFLEDGTPYPVEYKAGSRKAKAADEVQLCAQALCLEEMLGIPIPEGSIYYDRSRRRQVVAFTEALRTKTMDTASDVHALLVSDRLPPPVADNRCANCSLLEVCMPAEIVEWRNRFVDPFRVVEPA